jgi:4-carboxymuconolactone decarboxylase
MITHGELPWLAPSELGPDATAVYKSIAGGPRAAGPQHFRLTDSNGRLEGPFNAMVVAPAIGGPLQELGSAIRYRTLLTDRAREVAILTLATELASDFEWYAHAPIARACGISETDIDAIRQGNEPQGLDATETLVSQVTRSLVRDSSVAPLLAEECHTVFGSAGFVELVVLVGYYKTLDLALRVFHTPLPEGVKRPFEGAKSNDR